MKHPAINNYHYSSLRNALRLLNLFTSEEPELQLDEIASRLEIGQSTAFRLIHTLTLEGFIVRDSATKSYRLATSVLSFGHTIVSKVDLCHLSIDIIEKLAETTGETAHISVFKDSQVLYLLKIDSAYPVHLLSHAGKMNPIHCTSTGQVLLAYQPDSIIEQVLSKELIPYTSNTITEPHKLKKVLKLVKTQGYAFCKEELHQGIRSVAVPVKNKRGEVIAAITIAGPTSRVNQQTLPRLIKQAQNAADDVVNRLLGSKR